MNRKRLTYAALAQVFTILAMLLIVSILSGCAAYIDRDATQCAQDAQTVQAMTECQAIHEYHKGSLTDVIAQPLHELERSLR